MRDAGRGYVPIVAGLLPLEARRLSVVRGGKTLLDDVSFVIRAGAPTVIMGANGAGKSLLLRVLHGLIAPSSGSVVWGEGLDADVAGRRSALVFQRPTLLRRSVLANIEFVLAHHPGAKRRQSAMGVLEAAGMADLANSPARQLSGGEQQRLAMARALASFPEVLFADEPTASLDPSSTAAVEGMIATAVHGGTKVVLVTHAVGQARRLAGDVIFMAGGRVCEAGAAAAFFAEPKSEAGRAYLDGRLFV